jgi:hypothetical protein
MHDFLRRTTGWLKFDRSCVRAPQRVPDFLIAYAARGLFVVRSGEAVLHALRHTMDDDQPGDAAAHQKRRRHESPAQRAPGIEPAMASKNERDVSLQLGRLPSGQATPDLEDHCHLKEAAASGCSHAARRKNLRHQQYRHSNLVSNSPYSPYGPAVRSG